MTIQILRRTATRISYQVNGGRPSVLSTQKFNTWMEKLGDVTIIEPTA